MEKFLQA